MTRIISSALALAFIVAGVVYATIPDAGGNVTACYSKSTSTLRVIDTSVTNCKAGETSLSWSVVPQPGPMGPQGPQGIAGPQGPVGPQGPAGGFAGVHAVFELGVLDSTDFKTAEVNCPAGEVALSGAWNVGRIAGDPIPPIVVLLNLPIRDADGVPRGWKLEMSEAVPYAGSWRPVVEVICAPSA